MFPLPSPPLGPPRSQTPSIPRAPQAADQRVRPHIDKVANLLNGLLRLGFLRQSAADVYEVIGGGFALPRSPTTGDDRTVGAVVGGTFIDTTTGDIYLNTDNSPGVAAWVKIFPQSVVVAGDPLLDFAALTWGTPGAEAADAIEVPATLTNRMGDPFATDQVDVEIKVTDGAADNEPSATSTLAAAATPDGTVLAGEGTATLVIRTSGTGTIKVKVTESAVGFRYLWVKQSGQEQLFVKSLSGVLELAFA